MRFDFLKFPYPRFSMPNADGYRRFLVYQKTSSTQAVCVGFKTDHPGIDTRNLMAHQGETITIKPDTEVS